MPSEREERLSDAFLKKDDNPNIELVCKVYNINQSKGKKLLDGCKILKEYMTYVDYVRLYIEAYELKDAINLAIDRCIKEDVQATFFRENREEILRMTELDFTFERQIELEVKSVIKRERERTEEIIKEKDNQIKELSAELDRLKATINSES